MKAYLGGIRSYEDVGNIIVFAKNSKEALKFVRWDDISDYAESYIDIYAKRCPEFDDMEMLSAKEFMKEQWRRGWWFDIGKRPVPDCDEALDEEFYQWYAETFEEDSQ